MRWWGRSLIQHNLMSKQKRNCESLQAHGEDRGKTSRRRRASASPGEWETPFGLPASLTMSWQNVYHWSPGNYRQLQQAAVLPWVCQWLVFIANSTGFRVMQEIGEAHRYTTLCLWEQSPRRLTEVGRLILNMGDTTRGLGGLDATKRGIQGRQLDSWISSLCFLGNMMETAVRDADDS